MVKKAKKSTTKKSTADLHLEPLHSLKKVARAAGIDYESFRASVKRGEVAVVKLGRRYFLTESSLREMLRPRPISIGPEAHL